MQVSGVSGASPFLDPAFRQARSGPAATESDAPSFGEMLESGVGAVSRSESTADDLAQRFAVGDPDVEVHDVTVAASEASLNVQLLVAVRDRAVEAYQTIINLQV